MAVIARSPLPAGFAQAVEHVFVVCWPEPGRAVADIDIELADGNSGERRVRFLDAAKLAQGGCQPAI
jgi:hypothetical protein